MKSLGFYKVYSTLYDTLDQDYVLAIPKLFSLLLIPLLPPSDLLCSICILV